MTQTRLNRAILAPVLAFAMVTGPLQAQATGGGGAAAIGTGDSYSSLRGQLAFLGLRADDIGASAIDFTLGYQADDDGDAASLFLGTSFQLGQTALGQDTVFRVLIEGRSANWDSQTYQVEQYKVNLSLGAKTAGGLGYSARAFWQTDTVAISPPKYRHL